MERYFEKRAGVYFPTSQPAKLDASDFAKLRDIARESESGTARICLHSSEDDLLQEMVIAHAAHAFVRPHRHPDRDVTFSCIEGTAEIVFFDEGGGIREVLKFGIGLGRTRILRVPAGRFYSQIPEDGGFIFHELIAGPFSSNLSEWSNWVSSSEELRNGVDVWQRKRENS